VLWSAGGVQAVLPSAKRLEAKGKLVEAAGIEKVSTLTKSGTYSRNRCLKSASWTFALAPGPSKRNAKLAETFNEAEELLFEPLEGVDRAAELHC
jgi:hypothetical protein